ncbi:MAG TPA: CBS domain-containing protein [Actinophytocola sp.]|uniref:CBS domain-containing protein n=1 Tax=Actinophytocola sp. TaxID=1872138 RepID=UPI002F940D18
MAELTAASVMTKRVVTVKPETPFGELVTTMTAGHVRAVPVVDRYGQPIGVVSRAELTPQQDLPREQGGGDDAGWHRARDLSATELMTTPVRAVHAAEPVSFVARLFTTARLSRLFVVNWDSRLVGVVARRDLLRVYVRSDDELRSQIVAVLHAADITSAPVDVRVDGAVVTVAGAVARSSQAGVIVRMVRALPGVVDVCDNLRYLVDDVVLCGAFTAGSLRAQRTGAARPEKSWSAPAASARA